MADISYSNGTIVRNAVVQIWEDLNNERAGYFRAFWSATPESDFGSPVIGFCSPGGSHRTIRAVIAEVRRLGYADPIYRNGRKVA